MDDKKIESLLKFDIGKIAAKPKLTKDDLETVTPVVTGLQKALTSALKEVEDLKRITDGGEGKKMPYGISSHSIKVAGR